MALFPFALCKKSQFDSLIFWCTDHLCNYVTKQQGTAEKSFILVRIANNTTIASCISRTQ